MAQTLREKYTAKLLELGAKPVPTRSSRFHVFEYTFTSKMKDGTEKEFTRFVFLGKAGAVRAGLRNAVDCTVSQPSWLMHRLGAAAARIEGFKLEAA